MIDAAQKRRFVTLVAPHNIIKAHGPDKKHGDHARDAEENPHRGQLHPQQKRQIGAHKGEADEQPHKADLAGEDRFFFLIVPHLHRLAKEAEGKQHNKAPQRLPNASARKQEGHKQPRQKIEEKRHIAHDKIRIHIAPRRHFHIFERNIFLLCHAKHRTVLHRAHHAAEKKQDIHQLRRGLHRLQHPLFQREHQREPCRKAKINRFAKQL